MISVIVYGRNDSHGYNLPKRAALSFNCIAEVLTHPDDEIVFVDCNTPDDMPTFPESIADTLTDKVKNLLRILRVRSDQYEKGKNGTKFKVLEPLCRNIAIRRTNPKNRWILNTNTDMVFVPLQGGSLSDICAKLSDGFYELPRFEVPEMLWESTDRKDPLGIIKAFHRWGTRLHINETVLNRPEILFDGPGDFQLALREQMFAIHGMNEQMVLGWHVDSNLCKRLYMVNGKTLHLLDKVYAYHCDHTRLNTVYHNTKDSTSNDWVKFVNDVKTPQIPEQAATWGLAGEKIEELRLTDEPAQRYIRVMESMLPGMSQPMLTSALVDGSWNHGLLYNNEHILPYIADHLSVIPPHADIGYVGGNADLVSKIARFRAEFGHTGKILLNEQVLGIGGGDSHQITGGQVEFTEIGEVYDRATMLCFDLWSGNFPAARNIHGFDVPAGTLDVARFGAAQMRVFLDFARREKKRFDARKDGTKKFLFLGAQHTWFEQAMNQLFSLVLTPFSSYVRHGMIRGDAFEKPWAAIPLHNLLIYLSGVEVTSTKMKWLSALVSQPISEIDFLLAEQLARDWSAAPLEAIPNSRRAAALVDRKVLSTMLWLQQLELEVGGQLDEAAQLERNQEEWEQSLPLASDAPAANLFTPRPEGMPLRSVLVDAGSFFDLDHMQRDAGRATLRQLTGFVKAVPGLKLVLTSRHPDAPESARNLLALPNVTYRRHADCEGGEFDLYHIPDPFGPKGSPSPVHLFPGLPVTATLHDLLPLRGYYGSLSADARRDFLTRMLALQSRDAQLLASSDFTRADVLRLGLFDEGQVTTVHSELDSLSGSTSALSNLDGKKLLKQYGIDRDFFLHVGDLEAHKNFQSVVLSFGALRKVADCRLVVVGRKQGMLSQIEEQVRQAGLNEILFTGDIPREDLGGLYSLATGLLCLSQYEGFPFTVVEAMAHGCPVICSNTTSFPEVVGDAALVFPPDDHAAISQGMHRLLKQRELRASLRTKGHLQAAKFSSEQATGKTLSVWKQMPVSNLSEGVTVGLPLEEESGSCKQPASGERKPTEDRVEVCGKAASPSSGPDEAPAPAPCTAVSRGRPVTIGVDVRTFYMTDSISRGIGHYAFNHLKQAALQRPDWRFVLYAEEEKPSRTVESLMLLPNVSVKVYDICTTDDIDLFHITDPLNLSPGFDSPLNYFPGIPSTSIFYDLTMRRMYWNNWPETVRQAYLRRLVHFGTRDTRLLDISEFTRQDVLAETKLPPEKVLTIMAGLNRAENPPQITPEMIRETKAKYGISKPFFLHVGALDPHKNFEAAVHSLGRVKSRQGVMLVVVGEKDHYLRMIADHCAKVKMKDILFPGFIPRIDLEILYSEAISLLFLSKYEGFGFPVLEAMAQGCPVITTNVTSIPEVAGDAALMFAPDDHAGIASGMQRLLDDPALRETLRAKGRAQAANFSWEKSAQKTIEVWENLLGVSARSGGGSDRTSQTVERPAKALAAPQTVATTSPTPVAATPANATPASAPSAAETKAAPVPTKASRPAGTSPAAPRAVDAPVKPQPVSAPGATVPMDLVWFAPWQNPSGYCSEAMAFANALNDTVGLELVDIARTKSATFVSGLPARSKRLLENHLRPSVDVANKICLMHFPGSAFAPKPGAAWNIGRTMFETDRLPAEWVANCNQMDEVWVPSRFNFETFARSGVERHKLQIIPGTVDPAEFDPAAVTPLPLPNRAAFNFLAIFEWSLRKGWDVLLAAYLREFSATDDICLHLRTYLVNEPDGDPTETIRRLIREYAATLNLGDKALPRIEIISQQVPGADLPRLYKAVDCLVAPSRGEGWGRPQHEAMLMGCPVIATNWSGNTEFMTPETAYLLDYTLEEVKDVDPEQWHYRGHQWANPSETHLRQLMRRALQNPAEARTKGEAARAHLLKNFGPESAAQLITARLAEIRRKFSTPSAAPAAARITSVEPEFPDAKPQTVCVDWEGSFLDFGSLSHVNRELTRELARQPKMQVNQLNCAPSSGEVPASLTEIARKVKTKPSPKVQVTVRHAWPPNWRSPAQGLYVALQPWEFGSLPVEWVAGAANADEIWTYSESVRRGYVDAGVDPAKVKIVPMGIDSQVFKPEAQPFSLATAKNFKFLFVGGTIGRKGPDLLLQAYLNSFTAADDVCLVIKDFGGGSVYSGQTIEAQIKAAQAKPDAPEILYINKELPVAALPGLYTTCDCLVHPYRGEGFGLPVLEAMACGLPVVVTGGGSTDDFADDDHAYRIPATRKSIGNEVSGMKLVSTGWMLEPSLEDLGARMRWAVTNRAEAAEKGRRASEYVRREWTWERSAQIAAQRLQNLVARSQAAAEKLRARRAQRGKPISLPTAARLGHLGPAVELFQKNQLVPAWKSACEAIEARPFHPEGWLLLGEIAQAASQPQLAKQCLARAESLAPKWKKLRQSNKSAQPKAKAQAELPALPETLVQGFAEPRLTVCLIARNEEKFLPKCLGAVRGLAQQIVVVDTGSTDRTAEIAREHGAEVHSFAWNDDFSTARNAALAHARGEWILFIDADEDLTPQGRETLLQEMRTPNVMAYRFPLIDVGREDEGRSYVPRLFRNAPGLFYVGRVHEQVFSSVVVRCGEWGTTIELGKTELLHYGYSKELVQSRNKIARNLRLLTRAIEEMPNEANLVMNLGLELVRAGHLQRGLDQYFEAFALMSEMPPQNLPPELREALLTQMANHLTGANRFEEVVSVLKSPLAKWPDLTATQHFFLGLAFQKLERFEEAVKEFQSCLAKRDRVTLTPINAHISGGAPLHCMANCLVRLKRMDAAREAFAKAVEAMPGSRPARFDFARFLAEQGDFVEALKLLHCLVGERGDDEAVWEFGGRIALHRQEFLDFALDWTGEAVKHLPAHPVLALQRAEALLLSGDAHTSLPLWRKVAASRQPAHLAALTICEVLVGHKERAYLNGSEPAVSGEFIKWYQRLIGHNAVEAIKGLNSRMDELQQRVPSAAQVLKSALAEADEAAQQV
jgi:glycosyltransferase involved in cell wall biosynthesis/tetratricopeptide (TPR) repeat protein